MIEKMIEKMEEEGLEISYASSWKLELGLKYDSMMKLMMMMMMEWMMIDFQYVSYDSMMPWRMGAPTTPPDGRSGWATGRAGAGTS